MIKFLKIRDVKNPERELGNAGIDFFIPNYSREFELELKEKNPKLVIVNEKIYLSPGQDVLIPSGIKSKFDNNISLDAANKSGIALKKKLIVGAQIIDASYQGEIHVHLFNVGSELVELDFGQKIIQFIPRFINIETHDVYEDLSDEEFFEEESKRGSGGFGSTGV